MTHCTACNQTTQPYGELDPANGVVQRCGNIECKAPLPVDPIPITPMGQGPAPAPALETVPSATPNRVTNGKSNGHAPAPPEPTASAPPPLSALLSSLRARHVYVTAELARLDPLRAELATLTRMIAAAVPEA